MLFFFDKKTDFVTTAQIASYIGARYTPYDSNTLTYDGSNLVSQMSDVSGNGLHALEVSTRNPTKADGYIDFPDAKTLLAGNASSMKFLHGNAGFLIAVIKPTPSNRINYFMTTCSATPGGSGALFNIDNRAAQPVDNLMRCAFRKNSSTVVHDTTLGAASTTQQGLFASGDKIILAYRWAGTGAANRVQMSVNGAVCYHAAVGNTFGTGDAEHGLYFSFNNGTANLVHQGFEYILGNGDLPDDLFLGHLAYLGHFHGI